MNTNRRGFLKSCAAGAAGIAAVAISSSKTNAQDIQTQDDYTEVPSYDVNDSGSEPDPYPCDNSVGCLWNIKEGRDYSTKEYITTFTYSEEYSYYLPLVFTSEDIKN